MALTFAPRVYQRALRWHASPAAGAQKYRRRMFEKAISASVPILSRWTHTAFSERTKGGWYWIDRFRFELMMNWFEVESVSWCRRLIAPGMTVIDVGAHIGYYTRILSGLVGPTGQVLAFEPEADNLSLLRHNTGGKTYRNVRSFNLALGDRNGEALLYLSQGNSDHSLCRDYRVSTETRVIPIRTLDAMLTEQRVSTIDFVKIDVEGAELAVLEGMRQTVERSPDVAMLIECNPVAQTSAGASPGQLIARISELGFIVRPILVDGTLGEAMSGDVATVDRSIYHHNGAYVNVLCAKREERFSRSH
jgi:FkbM family methyltransferase